MEQVIAKADFAAAFGVAPEDLDPGTLRIAEAGDFRYVPLTPAEQDQILAGIAAKLDAGDFTKVGAHRDGIWEGAWSDTLKRFEDSGCAIAALDPAFFDGAKVFRFRRRFIRALDGKFEINFFAVFRNWLAARYLDQASHILEFGSGSGFNLARLAERRPDQAFLGLDWSESAVRIADLIGRKHDLKVSGRRFDFFNPDPGLEFPPDGAVATFAALEQVGGRFRPFLDFLLDRRPGLVLHMEPIAEFYDPANPVDAAALRYHRDRGYLDGFLPALRALEAEGRLAVETARRIEFGSLYHEAYSLVVWRPR